MSISTPAEAATAACEDERNSTDTSKKKTAHPGPLIQQKRITDEQALPQVLQFLKELIEQGNCRCKSDNRVLPCQCMVEHFGRTPNESSSTLILLPFARYICDFSKLLRSAKNLQLQNWIMYAHGLADDRRNIRYILPQKHDNEGASSSPLNLRDYPPVRVCQYALMYALNIGMDQWKSGTQAAATGNLFPVHGLKGRPSNSAVPAKQLESLHQVFQELLSTTTTIHNNHQDDHPQLPPDISKRGLYRDYCKQNGGWIVKNDTNGKSSFVHPISGSTTKTLPKELVSWGTFCNFWKTHYLHLETTNTSHIGISTKKESKKRRKIK